LASILRKRAAKRKDQGHDAFTNQRSFVEIISLASSHRIWQNERLVVGLSSCCFHSRIGPMPALGIRLRLTFAALVGWLVLGGCSTPPPTGPELPELDAAAAAERAMSDYDTDRDGHIAGAELQQSPPLNDAHQRIDRDGDAKLSRQEIEDHLKKYASDGIALYSYRCQVTLDGRPLPGATVTLVPEKFMGPAFKPATGETDEQGQATPVAEGTDPPGAYFGLYRVEVTKKDSGGREVLPARYHAQTILAQELGSSVRSAEGGAVFRLTAR
jgi:hypothetical protein